MRPRVMKVVARRRSGKRHDHSRRAKVINLIVRFLYHKTLYFRSISMLTRPMFFKICKVILYICPNWYVFPDFSNIYVTLFYSPHALYCVLLGLFEHCGCVPFVLSFEIIADTSESIGECICS